MRIAITGAGGNLGRAAIPELSSTGHELRLIDSRPVEMDYQFVLADVRDREAIERALEGCDAVVHAAALHGIHLRNWSRGDYWDINVTGTFNVYEGAKSQGIEKVVLCSTMGVYGGGLDTGEGRWGYCDETLPLLPSDIYGLSKKLAEELGRTYGTWGVETVALRLGMFVPENTLERYGFRLLFGGVDDRDVANAVAAALHYRPEGGFEAFNVMAPVPFTRGELYDLHEDLPGQLERAYPGSVALLTEKGIEPKEMVWWPVLWSIDAAVTKLGYRPRFGFGEFLEALRAGDASHYPVLGLPWWGV